MQTKLHPRLAEQFDKLADTYGLSRYALMQLCLAHYIAEERGARMLLDLIYNPSTENRLMRAAVLSSIGAYGNAEDVGTADG